VLNANDFFRNFAGQPRAVLNENQFGFSLGGPIKKKNCSSLVRIRERGRLTAWLLVNPGRMRGSVANRQLTNDRSPAALGRLFAGMAGSLGGVTIKADGSNINPSAMRWPT